MKGPHSNIHRITIRQPFPPFLKELLEPLDEDLPFITKLENALEDELPLYTTNGGYIRAGFCSELDHFRKLQNSGNETMQELLQKYRLSTGIRSKRGFNDSLIRIALEAEGGSENWILF